MQAGRHEATRSNIRQKILSSNLALKTGMMPQHDTVAQIYWCATSEPPARNPLGWRATTGMHTARAGALSPVPHLAGHTAVWLGADTGTTRRIVQVKQVETTPKKIVKNFHTQIMLTNPPNENRDHPGDAKSHQNQG
jgi:hypothetical protein